MMMMMMMKLLGTDLSTDQNFRLPVARESNHSALQRTKHYLALPIVSILNEAALGSGSE